MSLTLTNCGDTGSDAVAFFRSFSPGALFMPVFQGGVWKDTGQTSPVTTSGDAIRAITDFSGNGRHATSASAGASCIWDATTYARPSAATQGSSTLYTIANNTNLYEKFVHIFAVASFEGVANANWQYLIGGDFGATPGIRIARTIDADPGCWKAGNQAGSGNFIGDSTLPSGSLELLEARIQNADRYMRVNQRAAVTSAAGTQPALPIKYLFSLNGVEPILDGSLAFAMIYISPAAYLTASQVTSIRTYLGGLFGQAWS